MIGYNEVGYIGQINDWEGEYRHRSVEEMFSRKKLRPNFIILRQLKGNQWEVVSSRLNEAQRDVLRWWPAVAWYDYELNSYRCIARVTFHYPDPDRKYFAELSGTVTTGILPQRAYVFTDLEPTYYQERLLGLLYRNHLVLCIDEYETAKTLVFRTLSLSSPYHRTDHPGHGDAGATLGGITPRGRLIGGLGPVPPSDQINIFSLDLKDTDNSEWLPPPVTMTMDELIELDPVPWSHE